MSKLKQSCDSTGYTWQTKCHMRTSSMTWITAQRNLWELHSSVWCSPPSNTHIQEAGRLQAVLLAPQQQLQPLQAPVTALQWVWNICSEKTQGETLPQRKLHRDTYRKQDWAAWMSEHPPKRMFLFKSHFESQEPTVSLGLCHKTWLNPRVQLSRAHRGLGRW